MLESFRFSRRSLGVAALMLLAAASPIRVPYATPVNVHVKSEVSSSHAQIGDRVAIEVVSDVVVGGYVVIARGADGTAQVSSVAPATSNGPGQIQLAYKWVRAVDGSKIGVVGTQSMAGTASTGTSGTSSSLGDAQNTVNSAGVNSTAVSGVSNWLGRARNVLSSVPVHPKGSEGAIEPDRTVTLTIRNPDGVTISSTLRSAATSDDSDVK